MDEERHRHESFAQISFSRITGNAKFYGSELEQDHYIALEVKQSEISRDLTCDRYFAYSAPVIRLRLSSGQFSELITSMNKGDGVPCTLEMVNGEKVKEIPVHENRKDFVHRKFEDRMKMFANTIRERQLAAKDLVKKKTLSKSDMHDLSMHLEWLTGEIERNIPFFAKCFQETMDEVVFEAKTEVENAIQHKINVLGLEVLHNQNKLLNKE